ncbi:MAG: acyltransferase [Gammaproteobacteria bacterium]
MAALFAPPHKARVYLSRMSPRGYVAASATIYHDKLRLGQKVFIDERVTLFQKRDGSTMDIGDGVCIYRDCILETGFGGSLVIAPRASIHPRCQINAFVSTITIGHDVMLAPGCALYSYDHGVAPGEPIFDQPLQSKGDIEIGDGAWLGFGVIVLGGVRIGKGAAIGAGSVVTRDIPDNAVAMGSPAKVVKLRTELEQGPAKAAQL